MKLFPFPAESFPSLDATSPAGRVVVDARAGAWLVAIDRLLGS